MYKFEKLRVWQESLKFSQLCYRVVKSLPRFENNALSDQLRRASTSILLNIAEGSGSENDKEFVRYLFIARKSFYEVISLLKFIEVEYKDIVLNEAYLQGDVVGKLLNSFINKLKANDK